MAKQRVVTPEELEQIRTKSFFDCASPGVVKFMTDYYICGNSYKGWRGEHQEYVCSRHISG